MGTLTINKITEKIGAEVTGIDADHLLNDESAPRMILDALEQNGVLVFPKLNIDRETQLAISHRLGEVDMQQGIMVVSLDPERANYDLHPTFMWHMDGITLPVGKNPWAATMLTAVALADVGGATEFASTYAAYDALTDEEKERIGKLRAIHNLAAIERRVFTDPTPAQQAAWDRGWDREHPLVWKHRSGRKSLIAPLTADSVVGMERAAGRALLDELIERSTAPDLVYRHEWSVGDTVFWDNRGVLHRVEPYADDSGREMNRTTFLGDEPIQ